MLTPARVQKLVWLGLLALLFAGQLVFWQQSQDAFGPIELAWAKVLIPLAVLPWIAWHADLRIFLRAWPGRIALAWITWLWVSALSSPFRADALKSALEYSLFSLLYFLPVAMTQAQQRLALWALLAGSLLSSVYGFFQHFGVDPWSWSTNFGGRPLGSIGNPNFFGGHLVMAWGLLLGACVLAPAGRRRLPLLALLLVSAVEFWSRTVGVWLGLALSGALLLSYAMLPSAGWLRQRLILTRRGLALGLLGAAFILGLGLLSPLGKAGLQRLQGEKAISVTNRLLMWKAALELWKAAPVQGAGLASYRALYPKIQADILEREPRKGWNYVVTWLPHQNFLYVLSETGLIGLLLFCGWWAVSMGVGWGRLQAGERGMLPLLLAVAGMAGVSMLNTFWNIPPSAMAFAFLLGLLSWRSLAVQVEPEGESLWRPLVAGAALSLLFGVFAGREIAANRLFREGVRYAKREDHAGAVKFLQKAADMDIQQLTQQSLVGIWYHLGESLRQSGQLQASAVAYEKDLASNPWAPEVHNMLGANLGQLGRSAEAAEHLRQAVRLSPGYTSAQVNLGIAYATSNNLSMAAQAWQDALLSDPTNADAKAYLIKIKAAKP